MILRAVGLLALLLSEPLQAQATILFVQVEDASMIPKGSGTIGAGTFRTSWSRESVLTSEGAGTLTHDLGNQAQMWVHGWMRNGLVGGEGTSNNTILMQFYAPDGGGAVLVRGTGTPGQVKITTKTIGSTLTDVKTCPAYTIPSANLDQIDAHLTYTISGGLDLYQNSVLTCSYAGDLRTSSRTAINKVGFGALVSAQTSNWSEIIITDTVDTRSYNVLSFPSNTPGAANEWSSGGNCTSAGLGWGVINAATANIERSFVAEQTLLCTPTNGGGTPDSAYAIPAFATASADLATDGSSPTTVETIVRVSGTNYFSSPITISVTAIETIWATNPATGIAWTLADVTAGTFQYGIISKP